MFIRLLLDEEDTPLKEIFLEDTFLLEVFDEDLVFEEDLLEVLPIAF